MSDIQSDILWKEKSDINLCEVLQWLMLLLSISFILLDNQKHWLHYLETADFLKPKSWKGQRTKWVGAEPNAESIIEKNRNGPNRKYRFFIGESWWFSGLNPCYFHSPKVSSISPQKQTVKNRSKSTEEVQQAKKVISLQNANVPHISISFDVHL